MIEIFFHLTGGVVNSAFVVVGWLLADGFVDPFPKLPVGLVLGNIIGPWLKVDGNETFAWLERNVVGQG